MLFEHFEDIKQVYQYDQFQDLFRIQKNAKIFPKKFLFKKHNEFVPVKIFVVSTKLGS